MLTRAVAMIGFLAGAATFQAGAAIFQAGAATLLAGSAHAQSGASSGPCGVFSDGFGPNGFETPINDSLVFDDGSGPALYMAGWTFHANGIEVRGVARWDGTTLSQLGAGIDANIFDLCEFDDGSGPKLAAGGSRWNGNDTVTFAGIWDGQQWTLLGLVPHPQGVQGTSIATLAVHDVGTGPRLFAGGDFGGSHGGDSVAQWNGTSWVSVGGGLFGAGLDPTAFVSVLRVFDDGSGPALFAGGRFARTNGASGTYISVNVARWSGGAWTSVGNGLGNAWDDSVHALEPFDDGSGPKLVAGGAMVPLPVGAPFNLASWDGSAWTPFAADVDGEVRSLRAFDAASGVTPGLWVGGTFSHAGGVAVRNIARFDGAAWSALGNENHLAGTTTITAWDDGSGHGIRAIAGAFNGAIEWLENGAWTPLTGGSGADSSVASMAVVERAGELPDLFAIGTFRAIGGVTANRFARFDGTRWWNENASSNTAASALRVLDLGNGPRLHATGVFTSSSGSSNVARRDGSTWTLLPSTPTPAVDLLVFDDGNGRQLFAAGAGGLHRLDGGTWTSVIPQPNQSIVEMVAFDDGSGPAIFLAGTFDTIGGVPFHGIARWNGQTLDPLLGGTVGSQDVRALCVFDDGAGPKLYAGGDFTALGGVACAGVARWNGQSWSPLGSGIGNLPYFVIDLLVHDDGSGSGPELVATGQFSLAGGAPAAAIARWNGAQWRPMGAGLGGSSAGSQGVGYALAAYDDRSGHGADLFVGGAFQRAGGTSSSNLARWQSCGGDATTFCFGDGSITACPCGNASAVGDRAGCLNSLGLGGTLRTHGRASLSDDTLVLEGGSMSNSSVLYFQGASLVNGGAGVTFGDGVKCTAGPFVRLGTKLNVAGASAYPGPADPTLSVRGMITSAGTRHYQARYRNAAAFCTPDTFNYTSGVSVAWSN